MKAAVRYHSSRGHVKAMAEALARGAGVEAISVDDPDAQITEHVDLLFIGGEQSGFSIDDALKDYLDDLPEGLIDEAICFGSSRLTRRPIFTIQEKLKEKGIAICKQCAFSRNHPNDNLIEALEFFGKTEVTRDRSLDGLPPFMIFKRSQEIKRAKEEAAAAGEEYIPEGQDDETLALQAAEEAQAEAEAAEVAAKEAEAAALAAAEQAAEAARIAAEKARAAADAAALVKERAAVASDGASVEASDEASIEEE